MAEITAGASTPEERIRLLLEITDYPNLGDEIVYDERFRSQAWPRTGYALQRSDLEAVLASLDEARSAAGAEAEEYERAHALLGQLVVLVAKHGNQELQRAVEAMFACAPTALDDAEEVPVEVSEDLLTSLEQLRAGQVVPALTREEELAQERTITDRERDRNAERARLEDTIRALQAQSDECKEKLEALRAN